MKIILIMFNQVPKDPPADLLSDFKIKDVFYQGFGILLFISLLMSLKAGFISHWVTVADLAPYIPLEEK